MQRIWFQRKITRDKEMGGSIPSEDEGIQV